MLQVSEACAYLYSVLGTSLTSKEVGLHEACFLKGVDKHRTPIASVPQKALAPAIHIALLLSVLSVGGS